jgi:polyphosphate kinase
MVDVGSLQHQVAAGVVERSPDGLTPAEQLDAIAIRLHPLIARQYRTFRELLRGPLAAQGICLRDWAELDLEERTELARRFMDDMAPLLTPKPLTRAPGHAFPHLADRRVNLAVMLRDGPEGPPHFATVELPPSLPRFQAVGGHRGGVVALETVVRAHLDTLFPGREILEAHTFRVTRSAVIELKDEPLGGVLVAVEEQVARRPFGEVVRLEVESTMSEPLRERLLHELQYELPEAFAGLSEDDVYPVGWFVDLAALRELAALELPGLRYEPLQHSTPLDAGRSIFDQLGERDVIVRFPHDSFGDTVERFLEEAADDPDVAAIKITLYRTNPASRLVQALARARSAGKDAFALIELKASFDERRNIEWARSLERAGIHVVFSPSRIKVHAKIALVVRREAAGPRRYVYVGTGNLNAATARGYTDVGILTADPACAEEVSAVFNLLTGYSGRREFEHLLVSPFTMRSRFLALIEREIEHARAGRGGRIRVQMNGLADRRMIAALYRASHAGVRIDMAVREICALRPGIPGLSDNIRIVSLLGRFLQHARIFCFHNAGNPEYYIGSADWRPRNLSKRVEVATRVHDPAHCAILDRMLDDVLHHPAAWELRADGAYVRGVHVIGGS